MLTPRFSLSQTEEFLTVTIYAPFTHIDQTEIFMEECDFRFFSKPYYLRLHLPGQITESEAASGSWEADSSSFVVKCPKLNVGENFAGLDMLTQLLTPKGETEVRTKVEVIGGENEEDSDEDEAEVDWYYEQKLPDDELGPNVDCDSFGYGFGFKHTGVYKSLLAEYSEMVDLVEPDNLTQVEREEARQEKELRDFNSDHYLCDMFDSVAEVEECLSYQSPLLACVSGPLTTTGPLSVDHQHPCLSFTTSEQDQLLSIPPKQLLVTPSLLPSVHLGLADLLYGHSYTARVLGLDCVETGWCCAKLSSSLSCLARFTSPRQLVVTGIRRALCYPLYRHWDIAIATWRDVVLLLKLGKVAILKSLLSIMPALNSTPGHYIFNQLYVSDYTAWVQTVPEAHMVSLAGAIDRVLDRVTKEEVGFDLPELEEAARLTIQEEDEEGVDKLVDGIGKVTVTEGNDSDDSDTESDDSSSDDSDDSIEE
eukprot:GFUD01040586.1.p1 GENE.GFUD01040586.1~~GFUD01040586.1.p1  ORF type:complete len:480 (+),score=203.74 GFUD01040586.1:44-1483(+)